MVITNKQLMENARIALSEKWKRSAGITAVYFAITIALSFILEYATDGFIFFEDASDSFLTLFYHPPFILGFMFYFMSIIKNTPLELKTIFLGWKQYCKTIILNFFITVITVLGLILLIVPGIIILLSCSLAFYLIADNNALKPIEAIKLSRKMMVGHKWNLCCLFFRFFGWFLLGILTVGIGFLWLCPYSGVSFVLFCKNVQDDYVSKKESETINNADNKTDTDTQPS